MYKDWKKANSKNYEFLKKRTSIKRLYDLLETKYNDDDDDKITYVDNDPSFDYTIVIPKNEKIKAGIYNISKTIVFDWNDESDSADLFNTYSFTLTDTEGNFYSVENTHKHIPLLFNFFSNFLK